MGICANWKFRKALRVNVYQQNITIEIVCVTYPPQPLFTLSQILLFGKKRAKNCLVLSLCARASVRETLYFLSGSAGGAPNSETNTLQAVTGNQGALLRGVTPPWTRESTFI